MKSAPPPDTIQVLNPLPPQEGEHLLHRLVGEMVVRTVETGMLYGLHPSRHPILKCFNRQVGVREADDMQQTLVPVARPW